MLKQINLISSLLILISCNDKIHNQNINAFFNETPKRWSIEANPQPKIKVKDIQSRRIRVGVIDTGVDYNHPLLINNMSYKVKGNQIIGVGADVFGNDNYSYPNNLNLDYFVANGEEYDDEAKIWLQYDKNETLINELIDLDKKYYETLVKEVNKSEALKDSYFPLLISGIKSFHANADIIISYEYFPETESFMDQKTTIHEVMKKYKEVMQKHYSERGEFNLTILYAMLELLRKKYLGETILVGEKNHYIDSKNLGLFLKGRDEFYQIVQKLTKNFYNEELLANLEVKFMKTYYLSKSWQVNGTKLTKEFIQNLLNSVNQVSYKKEGPDLGFSCGLLMRKHYKEDRNIKEILNQIPKGKKLFDHMGNYIKEIFKDQNYIEEFHQSYQNYEKFFLTTDFKGLDCSIPKKVEKIGEKTGIKKFINQYVQDHGTHVSGIVVAQDPENIEIFPIRVLTSNIQHQEKDNLLSTIGHELKSWLENEVIQNGLDMIIEENSLDLYRSICGRKDSEIENDLECWYSLIINSIANDLNQNNHRLAFVSQLSNAIKKANENKIKIVNISLGDKYRKGSESSNPYHLNKDKIKKQIEFLKFEFYKYKVGLSLHEAKNTLFVIASGNDSMAINGVSNSGIPCDVSSTFFEPYENKIKVLPNNQIKNVICIGSMSRRHKSASGFSNILLSRSVPQFFAYGENILSPIPTTVGSCQGSYTSQNSWVSGSIGFCLFDLRVVSKTIQELQDIRNQLPEVVIKKLGYDESNEIVQEEIMQIIHFFSTRGENGRNLLNWQDYEKTMLKEGSTPMAYMSGTSMATPMAAGVIAREIVRNADPSMTNDEIFLSPDFSPENIIQEIKDNYPNFGDGSLISNAPIFDESKSKFWEDGKLFDQFKLDQFEIFK